MVGFEFHESKWSYSKAKAPKPIEICNANQTLVAILQLDVMEVQANPGGASGPRQEQQG